MNKRHTIYVIYIVAFLFAAPFMAHAQQPDDQPETDVAKADTVSVLLGILEKDEENIAILMELCTQYTMQGEYNNSLRYASRLREIGTRKKNERALMYANFHTGQSYLLANRNDSIRYYLDMALDKAIEMNDKDALSRINNALGIYSTGVEMNYLQGIEHFMKAMEYAKEIPNQKYYLMAQCNLSMTYYMRNDPAGLKYAEEVYELGRGMEDRYIIFGGAVISAYMRHMIGDNEKALEYIRETLPMTDKYNYHTEIYSLYANVLHAMGDNVQAEQYYRMALEHIDPDVVTAAVMTYLSYGSYLIDIGNSAEAIPYLQQGIELSTKKNNAIHRYLLYQRMSDALSSMGDYEQALKYFKVYHNEADSIFNVERERSINELRVKYQAERQENELQQQEISLMREQRKLQATFLAVFILIATLVVIYILYRRKDKMYRQIVRQQHEHLRKQEKFNLAEQTAGEITGRKKEGKMERDAELYSRVERLMREEKAYRQNDITIDKLAEQLGTNRTYLSRTINQHSGTTFINYMNGYRIEEAVRRLSDVNDNTPLKALATQLGYNHLQTFYTSFQSAIGMPPSKYREKLMELYRKNQL